MSENDFIRRYEAVKAVEYWTVEGVEAINRIPASDVSEVGMCNGRKSRAITNADNLRSIPNDMQLAIFMVSVNACPYDRDDALFECEKWNGACDRCWLYWLKQEVEDGTD